MISACMQMVEHTTGVPWQPGCPGSGSVCSVDAPPGERSCRTVHFLCHAGTVYNLAAIPQSPSVWESLEIVLGCAVFAFLCGFCTTFGKNVLN